MDSGNNVLFSTSNGINISDTMSLDTITETCYCDLIVYRNLNTLVGVGLVLFFFLLQTVLREKTLFGFDQ